MVAEAQFRSWIGSPSIKIMGLLILALLVLNAMAIWGVVTSRRNAESIAVEDLRLQTTAHARSLEAVLASRRGDFIFLSQSPPLAEASSLLDQTDPIAFRWRRLDIEGSLLLFLAAHQEVTRLILRDSMGTPLVAAGRHDEAPALLPAADYTKPAVSGLGTLVGSWPLRARGDNPGTLEAVLSVSQLLDIAVPGLGHQFSLLQRESLDNPALTHQGSDSRVVSIPVRDEGWPDPVRWVLVCREPQSHLLGTFTTLASRYRTTVVLNLVVMSLALVLGIVGFQQVRRTMALEAENRQQQRMRELERRVMHNERLASVGQLAAGMAHEINNPLEGMANYLSLLEEDLQTGRTGESLELTGRVREGLDRVAGIIRQVLTFADPGVSPLSPMDLNDVLNETTGFVRTNPAFRRTSIILRTSKDSLYILGNRVTLGQLLLNLLLNSCQVQSGGGQIEVSSMKDGDQAVFMVADCGPGIPTEILPRIFEPFYSTRGSTGLGLSVCHGIVGEHHGRISAQNRIGGGAVFRVEIPMHAAEAVAGAADMLAQ